MNSLSIDFNTLHCQNNRVNIVKDEYNESFDLEEDSAGEVLKAATDLINKMNSKSLHST